MSEPTPNHDAVHAREVSAITIANYNRMAVAYCHGTANHDVSQNIAALLEAIKGEGPHVILDLGCGPGRDLPVQSTRPRGGRSGRLGRVRRYRTH